MDELIPRPSLDVLWEITGRCNLACEHCAAYEYAPKETGTLSDNDLSRVISNLRSGAPLNVALAGGEPLLHPNLLNIIDRLRDLPNVLQLGCYTNGTLAKEKGLALLQKGVNVFFGLEGVTADAHDAIRGVGTFSKAHGNLKWLVRERERQDLKGKIGIAFTLTRSAPPGDQFIKFARAIGVSSVAIQPLVEAGNAKSTVDLCIGAEQEMQFYEQLLLENDAEPKNITMPGLRPLVVKYINEKYPQLQLKYGYRGCGCATSQIVVDPSGVVFPCRCIYPDKAIYKRIAMERLCLVDSSLDEVLQSSSFSRICELKRQESKSTYEPCSECEFLGGYCDPCWPESFMGNHVTMDLCKLAENALKSSLSSATLG